MVGGDGPGPTTVLLPATAACMAKRRKALQVRYVMVFEKRTRVTLAEKSNH